MRKPWGDRFSKSRSRSIMVRLETLQSVYTVRAVCSITIEFENSYFGCPLLPRSANVLVLSRSPDAFYLSTKSLLLN